MMMSIKAIFLDFYGTLVHEDDDIIPLICKEIQENSMEECEVSDIGRYWWKIFSSMFKNSYGETFKSQRELGILSLSETISKYRSNCDVNEIIQKQFDHWSEPKIFSDTIPFLETLQGYEVYILSNIDTADVKAAIAYHGIKVNEIITSEDVKSYKPRPELFIEALERHNLSPKEVLHIGDSLMSDVGGAGILGIATVWLNRLNKIKTDIAEPNFICRDLKEVRDIISGIEEGSIVV
ncbi:HAD family hydrolase [Paenibacillus amylolyticus]|uniref:HAD family hydrolase n=1 Tax=Paenibacillus TaxID=44249 RepID=UPI00249A5FBF|nr:HAD family hydrolase [Paenibacillus amylolyticus]WFA87636.1 HAD family hydrolase [Paenibacillus amylolyticus]